MFSSLLEGSRSNELSLLLLMLVLVLAAVVISADSESSAETTTKLLLLLLLLLFPPANSMPKRRMPDFSLTRGAGRMKGSWENESTFMKS